MPCWKSALIVTIVFPFKSLLNYSQLHGKYTALPSSSALISQSNTRALLGPYMYIGVYGLSSSRIHVMRPAWLEFEPKFCLLGHQSLKSNALDYSATSLHFTLFHSTSFRDKVGWSSNPTWIMFSIPTWLLVFHKIICRWFEFLHTLLFTVFFRPLCYRARI